MSFNKFIFFFFFSERSGLRRPGFTSRLPSAPSNNSAHLTRKLGKDTQKQVFAGFHLFDLNS